MGNKNKKNDTETTETTEKRKRTPFAESVIDHVEGKYKIILTKTPQTVLGETINVKAFRVEVPDHPDRIVLRIKKAYAYLMSLGLHNPRKAGATRTTDPKLAVLRATVLYHDRAVALAESYGDDCPIDFERIAKWIGRMEKTIGIAADSIREAATKAKIANKASRDKKIAAKNDVQ